LIVSRLGFEVPAAILPAFVATAQMPQPEARSMAELRAAESCGFGRKFFVKS